MDIEFQLKELERVLEHAKIFGVSPLASLAAVDKINAEEERLEYESAFEQLYQGLLNGSFKGRADLMSRALLLFISRHYEKGRRAKIPLEKPTKTGRPATSWGSKGEGKLAIYAAVEFEFRSMKKEGIKPRPTEALWRLTKLDRTNQIHKEEIKALCSAYSEGKLMVTSDETMKAKAIKK